MHKLAFSSLVGYLFFSHIVHASPTIYCAKAGTYLKLGMTSAEVKQQCGTPLHIEEKKVYPKRQLPVQQLFYRLGQVEGGRGNIQIETGGNASTTMVVTITRNKVASITLNGSSTKAATICSEGAFAEGSPIQAVINACGNPTYVNNSYEDVYDNLKTPAKEQIWLIKFDPYGETHHLTFVDDILQSID